MQQHYQDAKNNQGNFNQMAQKSPLSNYKITEESDIDFDIHTFDKETPKPEASINLLKERDLNMEKSERMSIISIDDRYNEIYTR